MFSDEDLVFSDEEMGEGTDFFRENVGGGLFRNTNWEKGCQPLKLHQ